LLKRGGEKIAPLKKKEQTTSAKAERGSRHTGGKRASPRPDPNPDRKKRKKISRKSEKGGSSIGSSGRKKRVSVHPEKRGGLGKGKYRMMKRKSSSAMKGGFSAQTVENPRTLSPEKKRNHALQEMVKKRVQKNKEFRNGTKETLKRGKKKSAAGRNRGKKSGSLLRKRNRCWTRRDPIVQKKRSRLQI